MRDDDDDVCVYGLGRGWVCGSVWGSEWRLCVGIAGLARVTCVLEYSLGFAMAGLKSILVMWENCGA